MELNLVPVNQALTPGVLQMWLDSGWRLMGATTVKFAPQKVAIAGQPDFGGGTALVNIWVLPEPTVPATMLAAKLVEMFDDGRDGVLLHDICKAVFGRGINLIKKELEALAEVLQTDDKGGTIETC